VEAYLAGTAFPVDDPLLIGRIAERSGAHTAVDWRLFELHVEVAMVHRPLGPTSDGRARAGVAQVWREATAGRRSGRRGRRRARVPAMAA
jgi:hypothetical protein